jgi:hypothetical protein
MYPACLVFLMFQVITYVSPEAVQYVGGTVTTIPQEAVGDLITADENTLSFTWQKGGSSGGGEWWIPYKRVTYLGYGQHAGRRVGAAMATNWMVLWSKKRRHYLTLQFKDDQDKAQTVVFMVGKKSIRVLPKILELRTGLRLQFEDEEAREAGNK